jgi:hypothetical protein
LLRFNFIFAYKADKTGISYRRIAVKAFFRTLPNFFKNYFARASFFLQTEHLPSVVIFGCSFTSAPQRPHFNSSHPLQVFGINQKRPSEDTKTSCCFEELTFANKIKNKNGWLKSLN